MEQQANGFLTQMVQPVLRQLGVESRLFESLLLGAAWTTGFSPWQPSSNRLGIYGLDASWHRRLWDDWLAFQPELASRVRGFAGQHSFLNDPHHELVNNLTYATAVAVCALLRHSEKNPDQLAKTMDAGSLTATWAAATDLKPEDWTLYFQGYERALTLSGRRNLAAA